MAVKEQVQRLFYIKIDCVQNTSSHSSSHNQCILNCVIIALSCFDSGATMGFKVNKTPIYDRSS